MTEPVTVLMPVGPNYNPEWLQEAIDSALAQTYIIDELLFVGDGHVLQLSDILVDNNAFISSTSYTNGKITFDTQRFKKISLWNAPFRVGFSAAFNMGMALATNELVMFLAADDRLMPEAVEKAVATWEANDRKDAWYPCSYIDSNGNKSSIPNNLALTTKHFFLDMYGGFPPAAFVGPDAALMSCLMVHAPDRIIKVAEGTPLYWIRDHANQETKIHTWKYVDEMNSIRNKLTKEFKLKE